MAVDVDLGGLASEGRCDFALACLITEEPRLISLFWPSIQIDRVEAVEVSLNVSRESMDEFSGAGGESDLRLEIKCRDRNFLLLIENKIDASATQGQQDRYLRYCKVCVESELYDDVRPTLFAPDVYGKGEFSEFPGHVTYEQVLDAYGAPRHSADRLAIDMIRKGIAKAIRLTKPTDDTVTQFWKGYQSRAKAMAPELPIPVQSDRSKDKVVLTIPGRHGPLGLIVRVKPGSRKKPACAQLVLTKANEETRLTEFKDLGTSALKPKSAKFRQSKGGSEGYWEIELDRLNPALPIEEQREAVDLSVWALWELYRWVKVTVSQK